MTKKFKKLMRSTRGYKYNLPPGKGVLITEGSVPKMITAEEGLILTGKGPYNEPIFDVPAVGLSSSVQGGLSNEILYQADTDTTTFLPTMVNAVLTTSSLGAPTFLSGGANTVLTRNATNQLEFTARSAISVGSSTNIVGGVANQIPYQTGVSTTAFITGGANKVLTTNASGVPTFVSNPVFTYSANSGGNENITIRAPGSGINPGIEFSNTGLNKVGYVYMRADPANAANVVLSMRVNGSVIRQMDVDEAGSIILPVTDDNKYVSAPLLGTGTDRKIIRVVAAPNISGGVANQIPYQTGVSTTAFITGGANRVLTTNASGVPTFVTNLTLTSPDTSDVLTLNSPGAAVAIRYSDTVKAKRGFTYLRADPANAANVMMSMRVDNGVIERNLDIDEEGSITLPITADNKYVSAPLLGTDANRKITRVSTTSLSVSSATNIIGGAANQLVYQTAVSTTSFITGGVNKILTTNASGVPTFVSNLAITSDGLDDALKLNSSGPNTAIRFNDTTKVKNGFVYLRQDPDNAANVMMTMRVDNGGTVRTLDINEEGSIILPVTGDGKYTSASLLGTDANRKITRVSTATLSVGTATNLLGGVAGSLVLQTAPNTTGFLPLGSAEFLLRSNADGTGVEYVNPLLSVTVKKALQASNLDFFVPGSRGVVLQSLTNTTYLLDFAANGYIMTSTGTGAVFADPSTITVGTATNLAGSSAGSLPYQGGSGITTFRPIAPADYLLRSTGTAPAWAEPTTVKTGGLLGGTNGALVYQSSNDVTSFLQLAPAADYLLRSTGSGPSWAEPTTVKTGGLLGGSNGSIVYQSGNDVTSFLSLGIVSNS